MTTSGCWLYCRARSLPINKVAKWFPIGGDRMWPPPAGVRKRAPLLGPLCAQRQSWTSEGLAAVAHRSGMQCVHGVIDINSVAEGGLYAPALRGQQRNVT